MTSVLFAEWFERFTQVVTERPLLLIFDGHLTHVSLDVIERAISENILLVKLPPHVTDKLQPLDVAVFGPLKREWERVLNDWLSHVGPKGSFRKCNFVDKLCEIWYKGLSSENICAGIRATGIWPLDRTKFPRERLDPRLLKRYELWESLGKPDDLFDDMAMSVHTPQKLQKSVAAANLGDANLTQTESPHSIQASISFDVQTSDTSTPSTSKCDCQLNEILNKLGRQPPPVAGRIWVPGWTLVDTAMVKKCAEKSFEEEFLDKVKGPVEKPPVKRWKVDLKTKVVSKMEYFTALKE